MSKKKYCIIGKPIAHSLSPFLHNFWFKKYNINAEYSIQEVGENNIEDIIDRVRNEEINGINITLPYKQKIIPYLDLLVNDAKITNSVNTVGLDKDKKIIGENTDVFGLQAGYLKEIIDKEKINQKVLLIGAGGVAPSVILALIKSNINDISITNRTYEKTLFLKKKFSDVQIKTIEWEKYLENLRDYDIIINATSLGLKDGDDFDKFFEEVNPKLVYIDTIYNPAQTKMIKHLKSKNIKTYNGLDMFIYQGQKAFYFWHKINPEVNNELITTLEERLKK